MTIREHIGQIQRPGQRPEDVKLFVRTRKPLDELAQVFWHEQTVYESLTIPDERNALSFGQTLTINSGVTVEVGTDSVWTINDR